MADPWLQVKDPFIREKHLKMMSADLVALDNHIVKQTGRAPTLTDEYRTQVMQITFRHGANALAEEAGALRQHTTVTPSVHHALPNPLTIVNGAVAKVITGKTAPGAPSTTATYYAHPPSGTTAVTATGTSDFGSRLSENLTKPTVLVACISGAAAGFMGSSGAMRFVLAASGFTVPLLAYTALVE